MPAGPAGHGWRDAAEAVGWRGRVQSACRHKRYRAHTQLRRRLGLLPRGACRFLLARGLANPAAEQPANLGYHAADMLVLSVGEPAPAVGEAQIEAQLVQRGIGPGQPVTPGRAAPGLGIEKLLGNIQRGAEQPRGHGGPEGAGESFALWHEPLQQVEYASENDQVFHNCSFFSGNV